MCIRDRYKLECDDCDKFYIGQTGRPSAERFKEHLPKSDISKTRSSYAQHLMLYNHKYSDFHTNFKLLHNCKKGAYMNAVEEYEIYRASKLQTDQLLNDKVSFRSNLLYNTAIDIDGSAGNDNGRIRQSATVGRWRRDDAHRTVP